MNSEWLKSAYTEYFTPAAKKITNLVMERGQGIHLYTIDGEKYLDFVQGVAANALGHCHPTLTAAAAKQLQKLGHASFNLVSYPSALALAAELRKWTGRMFAFQHFGIEPDILLLGKAVGGGYPLAVLAANREIMDRWPPGSHGSTFGGHPVACAAGLAQLEIVGASGFLDSVVAMGVLFREQLIRLQQRFPEIGDVRGLGLMNAIELVKPDGRHDPEKTAAIVAHLFSKKILVYTCGVRGNIIRFMPPLNVEEPVLDRLIDALDQAFAAARKTI